ncbi:MAG: hypothetical protein IPK28_05880 [Devosia sp.]|nr:hypothetical protein [Devosia sp.]
MKLTWFGGTTIRIHIGGRILVAEGTGTSGAAHEELLSGADVSFSLEAGLPEIDPVLWQPRRPAAMIDEAELPEVLVHGIAGGALLAAASEPPLLLLTRDPVRTGRWGREAVVVVFGDDAARRAAEVLEDMRPRLIAIAAGDATADEVFAALRDRLGGTSLVALEPGMALEV